MLSHVLNQQNTNRSWILKLSKIKFDEYADCFVKYSGIKLSRHKNNIKRRHSRVFLVDIEHINDILKY